MEEEERIVPGLADHTLLTSAPHGVYRAVLSPNVKAQGHLWSTVVDHPWLRPRMMLYGHILARAPPNSSTRVVVPSSEEADTHIVQLPSVTVPLLA